VRHQPTALTKPGVKQAVANAALAKTRWVKHLPPVEELEQMSAGSDDDKEEEEEDDDDEEESE